MKRLLRRCQTGYVQQSSMMQEAARLVCGVLHVPGNGKNYAERNIECDSSFPDESHIAASCLIA